MKKELKPASEFMQNSSARFEEDNVSVSWRSSRSFKTHLSNSAIGSTASGTGLVGGPESGYVPSPIISSELRRPRTGTDGGYVGGPPASHSVASLSGGDLSDDEIMADRTPASPSSTHSSMSSIYEFPLGGGVASVGAYDSDRDSDQSDDDGDGDDDLPDEIKYESLDYDPVENYVFMTALKAKLGSEFRREAIMRWVLALLIGMCTAVVAFGIDVGVRFIAEKKFYMTTLLLEQCPRCVGLPLLTYLASNVLLVAVAAYLVAVVEPNAAGSGIPEIKAYLNGVKVPRVVRMKTLLAKAVGVLFSVSGGLACGKEGPMIHSGAIVAAGLSQGKASSVPGLRRGITSLFRAFNNDEDKRDFVSGGAAAGVAAAFGAPVGGVLFSLEEGSSFWNQALTWRTFACSMFCSFILNILLSGFNGGRWGVLSSNLAVFGAFADTNDKRGYTIGQVPLFIVLGALGGLLGALFNWLNLRLTAWRAHHVRSVWAKVQEALLVAILTALCSFLVSWGAADCRSLDPQVSGNSVVGSGGGGLLHHSPHHVVPADLQRMTMFCPPGQYNAMAAIFFTTQETAIRNLFHAPISFSLSTLAIFFSVYFVLACVTYGISVPSGLFVPSILCGCALGRLFGHALQLLLPATWEVDPGVFALVGGAAVLGGIVRMTLSLCVILMEATNDITYGLPIMMTLMVAKWVGDYFNEGIYDMHIELKRVPFLGWEPPIVMRKFRALNVMSQPVVTLPRVVQISRVVAVLRYTTHNGFPIVDERQRFLGIVLRSQLLVVLKHGAFRHAGQQGQQQMAPVLSWKEFVNAYPRYFDLEQLLADNTITQDDLADASLDLTPYITNPYNVHERVPLLRVFRLFRTMGMRHLVVVDVEHRVSGIITRKDLCHLEDRLIEQRRLNFNRLRINR